MNNRQFKIDGRYTAILTLKTIACYLICILIIICVLKHAEPLVFIGESFPALLIIYILRVYPIPRKITVNDSYISFVEDTLFNRCEIKLTDIVNVESKDKPYNTLAFSTKSGKIYKIHPKDLKGLEEIIMSGRNNLL